MNITVDGRNYKDFHFNVMKDLLICYFAMSQLLSLLRSMKLLSRIITLFTCSLNLDLLIILSPSSVFEQINYFKADWNTIIQELSSSNLENSIQHLNTEDALNLLVETVGDIGARNVPTKKCKNKNISSFFKHRKVLIRKRRKLINRFSNMLGMK